MKKIIVLLNALILLIACNSNPDGFSIQTTVTGDIKDGTLVYLKKPNEQGQPVNVDTTTIEKGVFKFESKAGIPEMQYLVIDGINGYLPIIIENGVVEVAVQKDSINFARRKGAVQNEAFDDYVKESRELSNMAMTMSQDLNKAKAENNQDIIKSLQEEYGELQENFKQFEIDFVKAHPEALISVLLIEKIYKAKALPEDEISTLFKGLSTEIKETAPAKSIQKQLATAIGSKAPEFKAPSVNGEELALSNVLGKATIIDFWAAWCKPCRAENPNLVNVYNKYHDKGLNIVGVSLDRTADAWKKAIADDGLTWNHVSHVKYFNDPVAKLYNIQAIPAAFVLDENGVIVAKNLRGQALENKIAEMLQ